MNCQKPHSSFLIITCPLILLGLLTWGNCSAKIIGGMEGNNGDPTLSQQSQIIVDSLKKNLGLEDSPPSPDPLPPQPQPQPQPQKSESKKAETSPEIQPKPQLGKGQEFVRQALERNREILRQKKLKQEASQQKGEMGPQKNIYQAWSEEVAHTRRQWGEQIQQTYRHWAEEKKKFYQKIQDYRENLIEVPKEKDWTPTPPFSSASPSSSSFPPLSLGKVHIIPHAMDVSVKDQGPRSTCSAFVGIKAIEILLLQSGIKEDLSEQYFYWASKPQCQKVQCSVRGSWVREGLKLGQSQKSLDIPLESNCPYQKVATESNETQIPLANECSKGKVRVNGFSNLSHFDEVLMALKRNLPVMGGFKLTENFYVHEGIVTLKEAKESERKDNHAQGHAILIIGAMKLPASWEKEEGSHCLVVVNSWGEGWGKGGYGCLTEAWVKKYHFPSPFIALESLEVD